MRSRVISLDTEILDVIRRCQWCHVAMKDTGDKPYVIPMNFGFRDNVVYMHGAAHGKKVRSLEHNPEVCINFSTDHTLRYQNENVACSWSMKYRSVLLYGKAEFITDPEEKVRAMDIVMAQYSGKGFRFNPPSIHEVCVWKVKAEKIEGRAYGY